jgi:hypothetical protein
LLGLPLAFALVPKNWLYGLRTPRTMWSSDDVWYIQNRITGIAMIAIGSVWLAVALWRTGGGRIGALAFMLLVLATIGWWQRHFGAGWMFRTIRRWRKH